MAKICETCGTTEGKIYGKTNKFNKVLCRLCYNREYNAQYDKPRKTMFSICLHCGLEFEHRTDHNAMYCSKQCHGKAKTVAHNAKDQSCDVCGDKTRRIVKSPVSDELLCLKHYYQVVKHGETSRTIYDDNEFILHDDYAEIICFDINGNERGRGLVDIEDIDKIKKHKWQMNNNGYITTQVDGKILGLHRYVMDCPEDMETDHKFHDTADNRKEFLRICTRQENVRNRRSIKRKSNTGYQGVYFNPITGNFYAKVFVDSKAVSLGTFPTIDEALKARHDGEVKYYGEFRLQSNPGNIKEVI